MLLTNAVRIGVVVFCVAVVVAGFAALELVSPRTYTTGGDVFWYYGPLGYYANEKLLSEGRPVINWMLAQGWNPLESGQVGLGYPPHLVSVLVAKALGDPTLFLETSGLLHALLALGIVLVRGTRFPFPLRAALGVAVAVNQTAPMTGMNSHVFLTTLPWMIALTLVALDVALEGPSRRLVLELAVYELLFFWTCHIQMIIVANILLVLLLYTFAPSARAGLRGLAALCWSCVPLIVPLLYYRGLSLVMQAPMRVDHSWRAFYQTSVLPLKALQWTLSGGIFQAVGGWDTAWRWMSPALVAVTVIAVFLAVRRKQVRPLFTMVLVVLLLVPAIVPRVLRFNLVILHMRWPEKSMTLVGPMALIMLAFAVSRARPKLAVPALAMCAVVGAFALARGHRHVTLRPLRDVGAAVFVAEGSRCFEALGLPTGGRLAHVGKWPGFPRVERRPLPLIAAAGNSPLYSARGSAHMLEPFEPDVYHQAHLALSTPWRRVVNPAEVADPTYVRALRDLGVSHVVAEKRADLAALDDVRECIDVTGQSTFGARLPGQVVAFPWGETEGVRRPLRVLSDGALETNTASAGPPRTNLARPVTWRRLDDGRWRGHAELIAWKWIVGTVAMGALWIALLIFWPRIKQTVPRIA